MFQLEKSGFRQDINGLRAWAVVAVVLFHFGIPGFTGGFAGVDVFFVISGFLMTDIIVSGLVGAGGRSQFKLGSFYLARAKRIFPALIVLVLAWLVAGWFFLPTPDYQELGSQSGYALGFISNIEFAREAGYFDAAAHEKWMLHTWSLGAEWQFYLLYPLFLMAVAWLAKFRLPLIFAAIVALFLLSLSYAFVQTLHAPNEAFYLLPSRAWEMAAGGIVFFLARLQKPLRVSVVVYAIAWVLIIVPFMVFDAATPWPAPYAVPSVLGTMLVILAARQQNVLTAHPVAQWFGLRSYSLYLWHWPFAVLLFFMGEQESWPWILLMLIASAVAAELSYRWVENPIREGLGKFSTGKAAVTIVSALLLTYVPAAIVKESHFGGRVPAEIDAIAAEVDNRNPLRKRCQASRSAGEPVGCTYGGGELGVIVIGDSHAGSVIRAVERSLPSEQLHVLDWTASGCPVIEGIDEIGNLTYACEEFIAHALNTHGQYPAEVPMLIVSRFAQSVVGPMEAEDPLAEPPTYYIGEPFEQKTPAYFNEMTTALIDTACKFAEVRPVYMLRPIPEMRESVPQTMSRSLLFDEELERVKVSRAAYDARQAVIIEAQNQAAAQCGVRILELPSEYCDSEYCWGDYEGRPMYYDDDHLSEFGASFLEPIFARMFEAAPSQSTQQPIGVRGEN
ncbi:MAG: bifunctional acyltransferase / ATAT family acetyl CoA transporter [Idiomarinaceae bacterium HL-53]|nr:MAG: bifunctional acyltransferase / ATAT family acetyl CoA transporter [Idiomarinaceae bacterium HL-53]CUS47325.1 Peptidoglycan/LPS O-acetylase OafA/YrhL, contains acyltransferase and SGNH-hydrolase domains [Idiomarinaceae bacterium HL-53]